MSKEATNSSSGSGHGSDRPTLFEVPPPPEPAPAPTGAPRFRRAERFQVVMRSASLDALPAEDHPARIVWEYVEGLDLSRLYDAIRAVEGRAGRDPIDPRILMALWLYATLDGVGAAREVDRLCDAHVAYQWICGGVSVNYHTLSDFRTANVQLLDDLLTKSVAGLMHEGLVTMNRVAQDGMRVRANAGNSSFRRGKTLQRLELEARRQVRRLRRQLQDDPGAANKRQKAARRRAARERSERIARARKEFEKVEKTKRPDKKDNARASTTDPQARFMKMPDGGMRPAVNVQFATDTAGGIITGADVGNVGGDMGQMAPMIEQHKDRYGGPPGQMLVDGGFACRDDIDSAGTAEPAIAVYAPVQKSRKNQGENCYERQPADTDAVAEWRRRMATEEAKEIYKQRAATAEWTNAMARNRGMYQFLVRGLEKVKAVVLWFALAHNLIRAASLRRRMVAMAG